MGDGGRSNETEGEKGRRREVEREYDDIPREGRKGLLKPPPARLIHAG